MKFLQDLRVITLEQAVAAPLCSLRLAKAGAQVIKIERPEGDFARYYDSAVAGESSYFVWLNAGKQSVVLDLAEIKARRQLRELIAGTDVLVQNLKPGAMDKLDLGLDALHKANAKLISMSISGFSPDGPGYPRKAYDLLMQAESGLASITGSAHAPGRVGVSLVDIATGQFAYEAILGAVIRRGQTGHGSQLSVSLFDAVAQWLAVPYLHERYGGQAPERVGLAHPGICPYGVYQAGCGQDFILSVQNEREWHSLCQELRLDELLADPRCVNNETRVANRQLVDETLQGVFSANAYAALSQALDQADIAFAPVNGMADLKQHPDFHSEPVQVGDTTIQVPRIPGLAVGEAVQRMTAAAQKVPRVGEHTEEILRDLDASI